MTLDPVHLAQAMIRCNSVTPADGGTLDVLQTQLEALDFVCHRMTFREGEDPHLWRDQNERFHILSHNGRIHTGGSNLQPAGDCGRHLFSATGLAGTWYGVPNSTLPNAFGGCAYPRVNVTWADGSLKHFSGRERPHLVFGKDPHAPLALTNAVIDSTDLPTYLFDKAYTLVQPIRTK